MVKNYILIALRRLSREKSYVSINILSLALGIASFALLALYIRSELSFDEHNANYKSIYRLSAHFKQPDGREDNFATSQIGIGPLLTKDYPQLGQYVRFRKSTQTILRYGDLQREWDGVYLADANVFDVFTHKAIYGDPVTAFKDPYSIAINESVSRSFFQNENPIGKTLVSGSLSLKVSLVFADLPENSHLKYSALLPMQLMDVFDPLFSKGYEKTLWGVSLFTYFRVPSAFNMADFAAINKGFFERYMKEKSEQTKIVYHSELTPLNEVHFGEKLQGDLPNGNIFYLYGFAAVGIFILVVACINYINLATARAMKRAKEVGMRKVLGATRQQLIGQFLGESLTFTAVAMVLALGVVGVLLAFTPIGSLMNKEHLLDANADPTVWMGVGLLGLIVTIASGLYPAFYLSGMSPLAALTQVKRSWKSGFSVRQALVLVQLTISICVIACTLLMAQQIRYVRDKPLGFDKSNRLIVTLRGYEVVKNTSLIRSELRRLPNVLGASMISIVPGTGNMVSLVPTENNAGVFESISFDRIVVGMDLVDTLKLQVIEGRGFSADIPTDSTETAMVNESFVKKMGWEQPIGKRFRTGADKFVRVIGVVKDFHYTSLHNAVGPLALSPMGEQLGVVPELQKPLVSVSIIIAMNGQRLRETMSNIEALLAKFDPKFNFEPSFLEDRLSSLYKSETNLMKLMGIFSGICIAISLMGLFGLAAFTTELRTKEIGMRKVLGASDSQVIVLLVRNILPLLIVAAVPASIAGYYAIDKWLQRFAYHTEISQVIFALSTLLVAFVAIGTVLLQSLRTTRANPVDALRYE